MKYLNLKNLLKKKEFQANEDGILLFSSSENNNNFKLSLEDTEIFKKNFNKFENLKIKYKKNQKVKFSSKKEALFSKNFYFHRNLKQKLNLILFIDGLPSNEFYNDWTSKNCLKNTKEFFLMAIILETISQMENGLYRLVVIFLQDVI